MQRASAAGSNQGSARGPPDADERGCTEECRHDARGCAPDAAGTPLLVAAKQHWWVAQYDHADQAHRTASATLPAERLTPAQQLIDGNIARTCGFSGWQCMCASKHQQRPTRRQQSRSHLSSHATTAVMDGLRKKSVTASAIGSSNRAT